MAQRAVQLKIGFILAAAGSPGPGVRWFPCDGLEEWRQSPDYLLFFIAFICYPVMMAELPGQAHNQNGLRVFRIVRRRVALAIRWHVGHPYAVHDRGVRHCDYRLLVVYIKEIATGNLAALSTWQFGEVVAGPSLFGYLVLLILAMFTILLGGVGRD